MIDLEQCSSIFLKFMHPSKSCWEIHVPKPQKSHTECYMFIFNTKNVYLILHNCDIGTNGVVLYYPLK